MVTIPHPPVMSPIPTEKKFYDGILDAAFGWFGGFWPSDQLANSPVGKFITVDHYLRNEGTNSIGSNELFYFRATKDFGLLLKYKRQQTVQFC